MTTEVDVIVIGSGFGGAISASRIAEAGFKSRFSKGAPGETVFPMHLRIFPIECLSPSRGGTSGQKRYATISCLVVASRSIKRAFTKS